MRELKFDTGGRPLFNDDIKILQEDVYVALTGLLKGLRKNVIISGFEASLSINSNGRGIDFKPGLVYLDNEILRFSGVQGLNNSGILYIIKDTEIKPPLDSRTYNDGVEKPAIIENIAIVRTTEPTAGIPFIRLSINDISFQGIFDVGVDVNVDNYHDEANKQLSNFINTNIGGLDKCILNGLTELREEIRTSSSFTGSGTSDSFPVSKGTSIFYNGIVYFVFPETVRFRRDSVLKFVHLDKDRRLVKLVDTSYNGELLVTFNELEYYNDLRKNQLFPSGTILHIKLDKDEFEKYFPDGVKGEYKWNGWEVDLDSAGRVIVGHNEGKDPSGGFAPDFKNTRLFETDLYQKGGKRNVRLTGEESGVNEHSHSISDPGHNHALVVFKNGNFTPPITTKDLHHTTINAFGLESEEEAIKHGINPSYSNISIDDSTLKSATNEHENMPPYIVYLNVVKVDPS